MNFCKMCGTSLAAKPQSVIAQTVVGDAASLGLNFSAGAGGAGSAGNAGAAAAPAQAAPAAVRTGCPACGKQTPAGFSFCQHCGQRLGAPPAAAAAAAAPARAPSAQVAAASGLASTVAVGAGVNPTPPAGMPRANLAAATVAPQTGGRGVVSEDSMAKTMAPTPVNLDMIAQARAASAATPAVDAKPKPKIEPYKPDTLVDEADSKKFGQLVAVNRDGSDGQTVDLHGQAFDIGRAEGSLNFSDDPYLAARHVRLLSQNGKVLLRPIDQVNGVYVRVQGSCDLAPGDQFLVGKELLRFEAMLPEERDPPSLVEHGVRYFGSAPREAWGRIRQITVAGTTRDVWHLVRPELVLGREEGDVTFTDDEFMSRRHAAVKKVGAKAKLEDLNSSNGTFVRVRGDRELKAGDVLRMGDQLMRFEP